MIYRRHLLIIGAFGSMLAACELPFGSTNKTHVAGTVFDTLARRVPGAGVLILDGPQAGASTSADERGAFEFVSTVSGAVRLRASRDGFEPATIATEWQPSTSSLPTSGGIIPLHPLGATRIWLALEQDPRWASTWVACRFLNKKMRRSCPVGVGRPARSLAEQRRSNRRESL